MNDRSDRVDFQWTSKEEPERAEIWMSKHNLSPDQQTIEVLNLDIFSRTIEAVDSAGIE